MCLHDELIFLLLFFCSQKYIYYLPLQRVKYNIEMYNKSLSIQSLFLLQSNT